MTLLIVEALEAEVMQWLAERHPLRFAPELAQQPQALREALHQVHGLVLPASVAVDATFLRAAPRLRVLGRVSAGVENIDVEACRQAQVELVRSTTATANAEAEFVVGALLALLRRVPVQSSDGMLVGRELGCATVGLIGMTPAARMLAQLLPVFGTRLLAYDPSLHQSDPLWANWGLEPVSLRELMEQSDALSVQLPFYQRYRGLIGERVLGFGKPGQVMVSLSYSAIFDDLALAESLGSGRLLAAWFDSMEPGWLEPGRALHGLPGLQVTPRLASTTRESRTRAAWSVARRLDELLGAPPEAPPQFRSTGPAALPDLAKESGWR
ncbi:NAD(P)-dependent oxidoreductase [Paucibacter sp. APW11]|uniref:NAD(P)-dependent oxidoreductase n=1 Tax=Roseateles aquae TaxID=3077235 RepID=A0ABU3P8J6_9BURK|nr:NAD(P)-dependent oxidoreductase [Paucibacter sp. APW11]MDT8998897.1 NAD(P)-dependent oxidoreductase [Paucibacter sp. APW11]